MFYLTPQERRFVVGIMIVFIIGDVVQVLFRGDSKPMHKARSVRQIKININTARVEQFQMLPGIGAVLASRIVDYRQKNGPFQALEDLRKVKGLHAKRFAHIKEFIELGNIIE